jgi:hypothetical protein
MKIIILNFATAEVFIFPYDENIYDNCEDFFDSPYCEELGLRESDCQYMVVDNLKLQIY